MSVRQDEAAAGVQRLGGIYGAEYRLFIPEVDKTGVTLLKVSEGTLYILEKTIAELRTTKEMRLRR